MTRCLQSPLDAAAAGRTVRLERVTGDSKTQAHLASLGFVPGVELEVISRSAAGPYIVGLKSGRLMLDRAVVRNLWVA